MFLIGNRRRKNELVDSNDPTIPQAMKNAVALAVSDTRSATELCMDIDSSISREGFKELFRKRHFSICHFESLYMAVFGMSAPRHIERRLRVIHCVNWSDMSKQAREDIQIYITKIFMNGGDVSPQETPLSE